MNQGRCSSSVSVSTGLDIRVRSGRDSSARLDCNTAYPINNSTAATTSRRASISAFVRVCVEGSGVQIFLAAANGVHVSVTDQTWWGTKAGEGLDATGDVSEGMDSIALRDEQATKSTRINLANNERSSGKSEA
jgi:hypothetical protein